MEFPLKTLLTLQILVYSVFITTEFKIFHHFHYDFFFEPWGFFFILAFLNFQTNKGVLAIFLFFTFNLNALVKEYTLYHFGPLKYVEACFMSFIQ